VQGEGAAELYTALLSAYLLKGDLTNARFLWKRIPTALKEGTPELKALWQVCLDLWNRVPVFAALDAFAWSPAVAMTIASLKVKETTAAVDLLARSYSTVTAAHMAATLGVTAEAAVTGATAKGWLYTAETASFSPPAVEAVSTAGEGIKLQALADITRHLEK
jgi:COP9 signalosome complex subunit 8